ncbi:MAG: Uma2 family endonuclease [Acidobacteriota bacterium]
MTTNPETVLTVADLELMPEDGNIYEMIEGEIIVSRAPDLSHQDIMLNLAHSLKSFLSQNPLGKVWATPGVIFDEFNSAIPDLAFVSSERLDDLIAEGRIKGAPDLMIEIVSPGAVNRRRDRIVKKHTYSKFSVGEYWVVDPENRAVEIYRLDGRELKLAAALTGEDEITSPLLAGYRFKVESVFAAL